MLQYTDSIVLNQPLLLPLIGLGEEKCAQCKGRKVLLKKLELQVHIEKGMRQGQTITFPGLANEAVRTFRLKNACFLRMIINHV